MTLNRTPRARLETAHLVVAYAMSRLDRRYQLALGYRTQDEAFADAARKLDARPNSIKALRDEFDPAFPNPRRGWADRGMRAPLVRVLDELAEVSDEALIELVRSLLRCDEAAAGEALDALAPVTGIPAAAAQRLLTGRRAEAFVLENCERLLGVPRSGVIDMRESLLGYDFALDLEPEIVVEVKGLQQLSGELLFTDREWAEANRRRAGYWLAVVGDLAREPVAEVVRDPAAGQRVAPACVYERAVRAVWRGRFSLAV